MRFLKFIFITMVVLSTSAFTCDPQKPPTVSIDFQESSIKQINTLSSAQLGNFDVNTTFSHGPKEVFTTGGLTQGKISTAFKVGFRMTTGAESKMSCIWAEHVHIVLGYDPTVYIASEYPTNSCKYKNTLEHEIRHVNTDRITLKEYIAPVYNAMVKGTQTMTVTGPIPEHALDKAQAHIQSQVREYIMPVMAELETTRLQRQQLIDTRQEYLRLSRACDGKQ